MRNRILTSSIATLVLALAVGSASAAQVSDTFNVSLDVQAKCTLGEAVDLYASTAGMIPGGASLSVTTTGLNVICNEDLPYTMELDSGVNGSTTMIDSQQGISISATMITDFISSQGRPFGTVANGEHLSGIGTGLYQQIPIGYKVSWSVMPRVGIYTATHIVFLNF